MAPKGRRIYSFPLLNFQSTKTKCWSTAEVLDIPFLYYIFFTVKFQIPAKGDASILISTKIELHNTVPVHLNSHYLALKYPCAVLLQELLSPIPLNIYFSAITKLPDFFFFSPVWPALFLNKLTIHQLNIMQVTTLSKSLQC